jgi:membrane-bound lytic murein transglycosylase B
MLLIGGCATAPQSYAARPKVQAFMQRMESKHGFSHARLEALMRDAHYQQAIIDAMKHPAEAKPWYAYRKIFLGRKRIQRGAAFMRAHRVVLQAAEARYGVPAAIVTAILGVESYYGRHIGKLRVLDALTTLAFDYPPRAQFFTKELAKFLLLTRENRLDAETVKGSYAGAMGMPQFMPSSYCHYAVDFNGDGKRDLWRPIDAIGSIAHYLSANGWQPGTPVAVRANVAARVTLQTLDALKPKQLQTNHTVSELRHDGITPQQPLPADTSVGLIRLKGAALPEIWLGAHNFYVITTYNRSPLYAMAVYQLAQAIKNAADTKPAMTVQIKNHARSAPRQ